MLQGVLQIWRLNSSSKCEMYKSRAYVRTAQSMPTIIDHHGCSFMADVDPVVISCMYTLTLHAYITLHYT